MKIHLQINYKQGYSQRGKWMEIISEQITEPKMGPIFRLYRAELEEVKKIIDTHI